MKNKTFIATPITEVDLEKLIDSQHYSVFDRFKQFDVYHRGRHIKNNHTDFTHILLEQPLSEGKSAEGMALEKYPVDIMMKDAGGAKIDVNEHDRGVFLEGFLAASQQQPPKEKEYVLPSDEEIEKAAHKFNDPYYKNYGHILKYAFIEGAKWLSSLKE